MKHARRYDLRHELSGATVRRPGRHRLTLVAGGRGGTHRLDAGRSATRPDAAEAEAAGTGRGRDDEQLERSA